MFLAGSSQKHVILSTLFGAIMKHLGMDPSARHEVYQVGRDDCRSSTSSSRRLIVKLSCNLSSYIGFPEELRLLGSGQLKGAKFLDRVHSGEEPSALVPHLNLDRPAPSVSACDKLHNLRPSPQCFVEHRSWLKRGFIRGDKYAHSWLKSEGFIFRATRLMVQP